jgi:hypothetical protein
MLHKGLCCIGVYVAKGFMLHRDLMYLVWRHNSPISSSDICVKDWRSFKTETEVVTSGW